MNVVIVWFWFVASGLGFSPLFILLVFLLMFVCFDLCCVVYCFDFQLIGFGLVYGVLIVGCFVPFVLLFCVILLLSCCVYVCLIMIVSIYFDFTITFADFDYLYVITCDCFAGDLHSRIRWFGRSVVFVFVVTTLFWCGLLCWGLLVCLNLWAIVIIVLLLCDCRLRAILGVLIVWFCRLGHACLFELGLFATFSLLVCYWWVRELLACGWLLSCSYYDCVAC